MSGQGDSGNAGGQVRATFASSDQMQDAISKLNLSGFDRADLSVLSDESPAAAVAPESPSTEEDARQVRTLGASTAASVGAMAAAGITVATGGAAIPVIAAAVLAGGAAGGVAFAAQGAANQATQQGREQQAAAGNLVLSVRAATPGKQADAQTILRTAGGTHIQTIA